MPRLKGQKWAAKLDLYQDDASSPALCLPLSQGTLFGCFLNHLPVH